MEFKKAPYAKGLSAYTACLNGKDKSCDYIEIVPTIPNGSRLNIAAYGPDRKRMVMQSFKRDENISIDEQIPKIVTTFFQSQKAFWESLAAKKISITD